MGQSAGVMRSSGFPGSVILVGGGLVGLGTALALLQARPGLRLELLEKETEPGQHQSTHNSGVLHAGLYYRPGSLKARLAVEGIRLMTAFCEEKGIAHEICGKVVVATTSEETQRLRALWERGQQNGLQGLRWLGPEELREIEPHAAGVAALRVPEEGIVDYAQVVRCLRAEVEALGGRVNCSAQAVRFSRLLGGWEVVARDGRSFSGDYLVNCAGLHCDRVALRAGVRPVARIVPFRGEYYALRPSARHLVKHLIYPVPDPVFPFLGVHFTRLIGGGIEAGPNAVLALAREGYRKTTVHPGDLLDALRQPGLWRFLARHPAMCAGEVARSLRKSLFCKALQKLVPEVREEDLEEGGAGVRAQAMLADGTLVQDFSIEQRPDALHVLNAPSPAATASLAIGREVARRILS